MTPSSESFVYLKGSGLTVPAEPLRLVFELLDRGFTLTETAPTVAGHTLRVDPYQQLTEDDCRRIRAWKLHILALLAYQAPELT